MTADLHEVVGIDAPAAVRCLAHQTGWAQMRELHSALTARQSDASRARRLTSHGTLWNGCAAIVRTERGHVRVGPDMRRIVTGVPEDLSSRKCGPPPMPP